MIGINYTDFIMKVTQVIYIDFDVNNKGDFENDVIERLRDLNEESDAIISTLFTVDNNTKYTTSSNILNQLSSEFDGFDLDDGDCLYLFMKVCISVDKSRVVRKFYDKGVL